MKLPKKNELVNQPGSPAVKTSLGKNETSEEQKSFDLVTGSQEA